MHTTAVGWQPGPMRAGQGQFTVAIWYA